MPCNGRDEQYAIEEATGDPTALLGCNCRHSLYPFWVGIREANKWTPEPVTHNDRERAFHMGTSACAAQEKAQTANRCQHLL